MEKLYLVGWEASDLHSDYLSSEEVEALVLNNIGLYKAVLRRYYLLNDEEAECIGEDALMTAAMTYNPEEVAKFSTYATVVIRNALGSYIRKLKSKKRQALVLSLDTHKVTQEDSGVGLYDAIPYDAPSFEEVLLVAETNKEVQKAYTTVLNMFDGKKRSVIEVYAKHNFDIPIKQVGKEVGVSQAYASHIVSTFKNIMRKQLGGYINE